MVGRNIPIAASVATDHELALIVRPSTYTIQLLTLNNVNTTTNTTIRHA